MALLDTLRSLPNGYQPLPWLVTSGQPSELQLRGVADAGIKAVIDLREPMEPRPLDEPAVILALGMTYHNVPVISAALTETAMAQVVALLTENGKHNTPTLLHCASANRLGGPLLAYLMIERGMDETVAVDAAMRAGLRDMDVMEWGTTYAKKQRDAR